MPQTKKQEIVYTVMMVCVMVYGMSATISHWMWAGCRISSSPLPSVSCPSWASLAFCWTRSWSAPRPCASPRAGSPRQGQAGVPGGRYLLSVRVDDVPVDELFRHAALQGQPQRELFRHVGADHGDELSHGIFVAAVRRGPAGAVRVWQGSGRYEKEVITIS